MKREFLESLKIGQESLPEDVMEAILQEHGKAVRQLQLESAVQTAVAKAGGRNLKAITALLDMDAIGESQDLAAAAEQAMQQLKKENGYLFESQTPPPYARFTGAREVTGSEPTTLAGALRERMRKN